jgi:hypothetical protein
VKAEEQPQEETMKKVMLGLCMAVLLVGNAARAQEWYETMKVKGDLRYRYEDIKEEGKDNRQRDRIRARVGVFPRINKEVDAGVQLSTDESKAPGNADPISGNQTLTDGGSKKGVYLDLAYFDWHPELLKGFSFQGGKTKNPFIQVAPDFPIDPDFNPEGLAGKYHIGDEIEFLANAGYQWLMERSSADDTKMYAGQAAVNYKPKQDVHVMVGGTYYGFQNMEGYDVLDYKAGNSGYGNSTTLGSVSGGTTNKAYAGEYSPIEGFAEIGFKVGLPITLYGSFLQNGDADDNNQGYIGGIRIGQLADPKTFELSYDYRQLEKDAFVGFLADSDSWGGGTDGQGHKVSAKYQILKNWQAGLAYFYDQKGVEDGTDYKRLQVDLVAKF